VLHTGDSAGESSTGSRPPINLQFNHLNHDDLGFPAHIEDRLRKGKSTMRKAIRKLEALQAAGHPASAPIRNHIQASRQMLSLYSQVQVNYKSKVHANDALAYLRTVGPDAEQGE